MDYEIDEFLEMQYKDRFISDIDVDIDIDTDIEIDIDFHQCFNCDAPTSNYYCHICIHSEGDY